jgi:peptide-methionine (S)-S-oxide reductase
MMKRLLVPLLAIALLMPVLNGIASAADTAAAKAEKAMFAAGCFWKTQYVFSKVPGVISTRVGYSGGTTTKPSYEQVCSDRTGHAETVLVEFDPTKVSYHHLLEVFWSNHDPTTVNRQGPDNGSQYRSVVFYTSPSQKKEALALKDELNRSHKFVNSIVTEIVPAGPFYDAENYHQNYYAKHGAVCF